MTGRVATCAEELLDDAEVCDAVCDRERLIALARTGLVDESHPDMEMFACWVRDVLEVPSAIVSLVQVDRQVFPGAAGMHELVERTRSLPLTESLCKYVVASAQPLTIADVRDDPRSRDNPAFPELGIIAYAGAPLTDGRGYVLGSLVAIDQVPRQWSEEDVAALTRLARACSAELRLRLADDDAFSERERRDVAQAGQQRALDHSQVLLAAAEAFAETATVADVRTQIGALLDAAVHPDRLDVVVLDPRARLRSLGPAGPADGAVVRYGPGSPAATAVEQARLLHYPDRAAFASAHPGRPVDDMEELGLHSVVAVPMPAADGPVGAVVLGWTTEGAVTQTDLMTIATIGGFAGQAFWRARQLLHHAVVAREMQNAMLTTVPKVADLPMAARYAPADSRETVGGDWYDVAPLTDPDRPGDEVVMLSVGDIVGHSLHAVTLMGQARSMLRQAASDHPGGSPSLVVECFETANGRFAVGAAGTAIVAELRRTGSGGWSMTWTNAGHPPPVLIGPDGRAELLEEHDPLFGFDLTETGDRTDHTRDIAPGSLLFLYTDGLVEKRDSDMDAGIALLLGLLDRVRGEEPQDIVDAAVDGLAPNADDDVVAFAVRFP